MGRNAISMSYSAHPDEVRQWERHAERFEAGRSAMMRHALSLMNREQLVDHLRHLQDIGDETVAAQELRGPGLEAVLRASSDKPDGELDESISRIVALIAEGHASTDRPTRERKALPVELLSEQEAATA